MARLSLQTHGNFAGLPPGELLERLIGLSLYTEENLR